MIFFSGGIDPILRGLYHSPAKVIFLLMHFFYLKDFYNNLILYDLRRTFSQIINF